MGGIYAIWRIFPRRNTTIDGVASIRLRATGKTAGERTPQVPQLPVRERLVLELLLQGYSRKAIAATLGLSINIVAGYARNIYRFFGVASHGGLSRLFRLS